MHRRRVNFKDLVYKTTAKNLLFQSTVDPSIKLSIPSFLTGKNIFAQFIKLPLNRSEVQTKSKKISNLQIDTSFV